LLTHYLESLGEPTLTLVMLSVEFSDNICKRGDGSAVLRFPLVERRLRRVLAGYQVFPAPFGLINLVCYACNSVTKVLASL
jgi:hypothetical protein